MGSLIFERTGRWVCHLQKPESRPAVQDYFQQFGTIVEVGCVRNVRWLRPLLSEAHPGPMWLNRRARDVGLREAERGSDPGKEASLVRDKKTQRPRGRHKGMAWVRLGTWDLRL